MNKILKDAENKVVNNDIITDADLTRKTEEVLENTAITEAEQQRQNDDYLINLMISDYINENYEIEKMAIESAC